MNVIFGASGSAKEIDFFLTDNDISYKTNYFVSLENIGTRIFEAEIISESHFFEIVESKPKELIKTYIGIGSPEIRQTIFTKLKGYKNITFPDLFHKSVIYDRRSGALRSGGGNVICAGCILTTNISIGQQNQVNTDVTIGHDSLIGDFNTLSPGVHISGNVTIKNKVFIGVGAVILEKLHIGNDVVIGAGATVTKNLIEPGTYVGTPAKRIK